MNPFTAITAFLTSGMEFGKALLGYLNRKLRWTQIHDIKTDKEKLAALAADGSPAAMLLADELAGHIAEESQLVGIEVATENNPDPPRAIPVPGGDSQAR